MQNKIFFSIKLAVILLKAEYFNVKKVYIGKNSKRIVRCLHKTVFKQ